MSLAPAGGAGATDDPIRAQRPEPSRGPTAAALGAARGLLRAPLKRHGLHRMPGRRADPTLEREVDSLPDHFGEAREDAAHASP